MASISEFSIKKPVTTTMIIITMVVFGIIGLMGLPQELLPNFAIPVATVQTTWVGASPDDIDKLVTREIEDIVPNIEGVKKFSSTSQLNASVVVIEFDYGIDVDDKLNDIRNEVSKIRGDMPTDIDEPIIDKVDVGASAAIMLEISGKDTIELRSVAENLIKPRLERIEGAGEVSVIGGLEKEVRVSINPEKLENYGISVTEVTNILKSSSINLPAGNIKEGDKEFLVKIEGEIETEEQVANIVIKNINGQILRLSDIANVSLTTKEPTGYTRVNGKDAIAVSVSKTNEGNAVKIVDEVKSQLDEIKTLLPKGSNISIGYDASEFIKNSISTVQSNALGALILATIILFVFLKSPSATIIIATAIPTSVIFTFAFLSGMGISLNVISLMGLSLGVGMLVDNSVVVLDNIFRHMTELKKPRMEAARDGASEMGLPILASTATTVAVFLPIVFRQGLAKEIFSDMSYTITFSLLASLIVALTFVPMASSKFLKANSLKTEDGKILTGFKNLYGKFLNICLKHRIITLVVTILLFLSSLQVAKTLGGEFMPKQDESKYAIIAEMPAGSDLEKSNRIAKMMEQVVSESEYTQKYNISIQPTSVVINIDLAKKKDRKTSVFEIVDEIRPLLSGVPDVKLNVATSFKGPGSSGKEFQIDFLSNNTNQLETIIDNVKEQALTLNELVDVTTSLEGGNPEARIILDRAKAQYYGIRASDVAINTAYQILGEDPITIKTDNEEIDVTVQLDEKYRRSTQKLMDTRITGVTGQTVKLSDIATLEIAEGPSKIEKKDKVRKATVEANLAKGATLKDAQAAIVAKIEKMNLPKEVKYEFGGDSEQQADTMKELSSALGIAIFLIYFILASQLESFVLPFIIIGTIPLSVIGVFYGLFITGTAFNVMVMVGIIMLAGIVVNNAIVLIDYINILIERGVNRMDAIKESGKTRFRPILMTTLTTVFGMIPLALSNGEGAEMYKGMAIAVIFGLSASTLLTLIVIPVLYSIVEGIKDRIFKTK